MSFPNYWKPSASPYAAGSAHVDLFSGEWLPTFGIRVANFVFAFNGGNTDLAGDAYVEVTDLESGTPSAAQITRCALIAGDLSTTLTGWALNAGNSARLTAGNAQTGLVVLRLAHPPGARVRGMWDATAGSAGAGANTLSISARAWGP